MQTNGASKAATAFGNRVARILKATVGLIILIGIAINFSNVVGRFVFAAPIHWTEEILTFMMVWITFLAAGAIAWEGTHLSIDLLQAFLKKRALAVVVAFGTLATITISLVMMTQSWSMLLRFLNNDQVSLVAEVQLEWAHAPVPLGFGLMAFLLALRVIARVDEEHDILQEEAGNLAGRSVAADATHDEKAGQS